MFSCNADEYITHVCLEFSLLNKTDVILNLKKGEFNNEETDYLRPVLRPVGVKLADHNTDAICNLKPLHNEPEFRALLRLCNVYWQPVPSFASIAAGLNQTLRKGKSRMFWYLQARKARISDTTAQTGISTSTFPTTQQSTLDPWHRCVR